jgi:hypothetical protein
VTGVLAVTALVLTLKVALLDPGPKATLAGTVAADALLARLTDMLPGAGPLRVTVPVEADPPVTAPGLTATDETVTAPGEFV